ncbi:CAAX amino terminal protease self- immunity [Phycisphaerae bacterium RAS2]|nr:CAAX amino terminal protease self- immunity [Phycisphaerae bacterium RAS2]
MHNPPDKPHAPVARPIVNESPAPRAAFTTRPVDYAADLDQPTAPTGFPRLTLSRRAALADIFAVVALVALYETATILSGLHETLHVLVPRGGLYVGIVLNGLFCLGAVSAVLKLRGQSPADLGLTPIAPRRLLGWTAAAVPACYALGAAAVITTLIATGRNILEMADERTVFLDRMSDINVSWIAPVVLFVGVYEEILFRGFLLPRLRTIFGNDAGAILVSAALFGAAHYPTQGLEGAMQTGAVGLVLAILVTRLRNLWPAILTHAAIDGISLLATIVFLPAMQEALNTLTTQPTSGPIVP